VTDALGPGATLGFIGLGRMGGPMVERLAAAGYGVQGFDPSPAAVQRLEAVPGFTSCPSAAAAAAGAAAVLLMLPDSKVVVEVVLSDGVLDQLQDGSVLVDMSSSEPGRAQELAARAAQSGVGFIDAPVSGGVSGAVSGALTIMVGGDAGTVEQVRPVLSVLGSRVLHCGPVGAGDAVKALNNLMSATHLLVTSEAMEVARRFGLDAATVLDVVNTSSGRSGSTQNKWPNFVLPETYDSGFGLRLMLKDMRIALDLAESVGAPRELSRRAVDLWDRAAEALDPAADHTEVARWLHDHDPATPSTAAKEPT